MSPLSSAPAAVKRHSPVSQLIFYDSIVKRIVCTVTKTRSLKIACNRPDPSLALKIIVAVAFAVMLINRRFNFENDDFVVHDSARG